MGRKRTIGPKQKLIVPKHVRSSSAQGQGKVFCFDIDGVISTLVPNNDYSLSEPCNEMIEKINAIYDYGHEVILFTARGSKTGIDWSDLTKKQLKSWGIKYHELLFGKPSADYYIDDRNLTLETLNRVVEKLGIVF